jgi:hypothetical protein
MVLIQNQPVDDNIYTDKISSDQFTTATKRRQSQKVLDQLKSLDELEKEWEIQLALEKAREGIAKRASKFILQKKLNLMKEKELENSIRLKKEEVILIRAIIT